MSSHDPLNIFIQALNTFWADSIFMAVVRFLAFVYVLVLIIDITLLVFQRNLRESLSETLTGAKRPQGSRAKYIKRWEKILARLESGNPSQYKAAVLEADTFAFEILGALGYRGVNLNERLENSHEHDIETKHDVVAAHTVRNRIIHDPDYELNRAEAQATLDAYHAFFEEVDIF